MGQGENMKRHRPRKSRPVIAKGERVKAGDWFTVSGDKYGRSYTLHPTKGWRSRAGVRGT